MKKFNQLIVTLGLLIPSVSLAQAPLSGDYTVGVGGDYTTITAAIAAINEHGLSEDVTLNIESGTYNEEINLSNLNNGGFRITFEGINEATTIIHPPGTVGSSGAGILIDDTDRVTIQNLTLEMDDISDEQVDFDLNATKGIAILNSEDIILDNVHLKNDSETSDFNDDDFFISSALSITNVNTLTVSYCSFSGAGSHITLGEHSDVSIFENSFQTANEMIRKDPEASDDPTGNNLLIEGNEFTGPFNSAIELSHVEDLIIRSNELDGIDGNESGSGVSSFENIDLTIEDNTIKNLEYGIDMIKDTTAMVVRNQITATSGEAFYVGESSDLKVVNNFFGDVVLLSRLFNFDFIHNTVVSASSDVRSEVLFLEVDDDATGDPTARISNNIFVGNNQVLYWLIAYIDFNQDVDYSLDHNLYYLDDDTGMKPLVYFVDSGGETHYGDLTEWQNTGQYDQNSQSFAPSFASTTDFHIPNATDYRFGAVLDDVTEDIDGDGRLAAVGYDVGADQFCETEENEVSIEACGSYSFDGNSLRSSGAYQATFKNQIGCDSLVTLNLTILPTYTEQVEVETCEPYEFDGALLSESGRYFSSLQSVQGCDSLVTLDLTILEATTSTTEISACESYEWNDMTFTASGTYEELLTNAAGCDSTATLVLTILEPSSGSREVSACDSYTWEGDEYTASGTYQKTLLNTAGCDSVATLDLTILASTSSVTQVSACESYDWNGMTYAESGMYSATLVNAAGCDSVATLALTLLSTSSSETIVNSCGSYEWGGALYTESGNYEQLLTNAAGCDSTAVLELTVLVSDQVELAQESCGAYDFGDLTLSATGDYQQIFTNEAGCDSIVDLSFTYYAEPVMDIIISDATVAVPDQAGFSYQWINCETGEAITGETSNEFTPEESGTYAVEVNNGLCSETSICVERVIVLSASAALLSEISIFPNPTSDFLNIDLNRTRQEISVELLTLDGKKVLDQRFYNQDQLQLNVKGRQGIHLLRLDIDDEGHVFQKVLLK